MKLSFSTCMRELLVPTCRKLLPAVYLAEFNARNVEVSSQTFALMVYIVILADALSQVIKLTLHVIMEGGSA